MTIVEGQVETLTHLKESLRKSGVTRFSSIGEIRSFLKGYELEKEQLPIRIEREVDAEIRSAMLNLESEGGTEVRNRGRFCFARAIQTYRIMSLASHAIAASAAAPRCRR